MPKTMQLQMVVMRLVTKSAHRISGLCRMPCNMKHALPMPIIRNVGNAMPSVFRVRMVVMACGR